MSVIDPTPPQDNVAAGAHKIVLQFALMGQSLKYVKETQYFPLYSHGKIPSCTGGGGWGWGLQMTLVHQGPIDVSFLG